VVTIGDSRPVFKDEGSTSRVIGPEVQTQRRTLFQDIFGATAFTSTPVEMAQIKPRSSNKNAGLEIFEEPIYSIPSLDILFDSLVKPFLEGRPVEDDVVPDNHDEWVEEDVDMDNEIVVSADHGSREPNIGEMDMFIKLFRTSCMTGN